MAEKNLECDLKKKINKRWYLECLPLFSMFINIVLLLIILWYFSENKCARKISMAYSNDINFNNVS